MGKPGVYGSVETQRNLGAEVKHDAVLTAANSATPSSVCKGATRPGLAKQSKESHVETMTTGTRPIEKKLIRAKQSNLPAQGRMVSKTGPRYLRRDIAVARRRTALRATRSPLAKP